MFSNENTAFDFSPCVFCAVIVQEAWLFEVLPTSPFSQHSISSELRLHKHLLQDHQPPNQVYIKFFLTII